MNIDNLTLIELKSLAYDTLAKIETEQNNFKLISSLIEKRKQEAAVAEAPVTEIAPVEKEPEK